MPRPQIQLPTEDGAAGDFARHLAILLGTAYVAAPDSHVEADLLAYGGALAEGRATNLAALDEAFPDTVSQLLGEWEAQYGLPSRADLTTAQRRDRLVAKVRAARAATPASILSAVRVLASEAALYENTAADVASTNPRNVFMFTVAISAAHWADTDLRTQIEAVIQQMKPAHTDFRVATRVGFRVDDPLSLVDRDVLGS